MRDQCKFEELKLNTILLKLMGKNLPFSGTKACYNYRADPDLGLGWIAVRRIPCACKACIDQLKLPWDHSKGKQDQPRYKRNPKCEKEIHQLSLFHVRKCRWIFCSCYIDL